MRYFRYCHDVAPLSFVASFCAPPILDFDRALGFSINLVLVHFQNELRQALKLNSLFSTSLFD